MKKKTGYSREVNRISRRDSLPLLRGMFVSPESAEKNYKPVQRNSHYYGTSEDGLFLTADKGNYLGE